MTRGVCLGEPVVQTVDQPPRFVDIAAKLRPLPTRGGTTAKRLVLASLFDPLELEGEVGDSRAQFG
jgi:hypothetical protein